MKIIVNTSDSYHHILPIFIHLFNKFWGYDAEIVGYKKPDFELPSNFTFHSMGVQGAKDEFSNDFKKYIEQQPKNFIWMCEDTFIYGVNKDAINSISEIGEKVGKICLTNESMKREHTVGAVLFTVSPTADYRLSSQPAIWNRDFLLQSLKPDLTIWEWESQHPKNDGWTIFGFNENILRSNEGVRKHDIHKYDLNGIDEETINEMKGLGII